MPSMTHAARLALAVSPLRLFRVIGRGAALVRSRHALARLDDHLLRDIGLTRHEAEEEASRAPWDAPPHWRG
jgi:uncharacterized protein YjiS (DUF1127 family)